MVWPVPNYRANCCRKMALVVRTVPARSSRPFGEILLNNGTNRRRSFGVCKNAFSRLGGQAAELVFRFDDRPCCASINAECFRLSV